MKEVDFKEVIDFYVDLIDEDEANKILEEFREKVKGFTHKNPPLDLKKNHIKKIFKRQVKVTQKGKKDPFLFHLERYKIKSLMTESLTKKELLQFLSDMDLHDVPEHKRFAIAYIHYPEVTKKLLSIFKERFKQGKPIFDIEYQFTSNDEVKNYFRKTGAYTGDYIIESIVNDLQNYITVEENDILNKLDKQIKPLNFLQFHKKLKFYLKIKGYKRHLVLYSYIRTHINKEDDDILISMLFDVMDDFLLELKKRIMTLQQYVEEKENINNIEYEVVENLIKEKEKELEKYKKDYDKLKEKMDKLKQKTNKYKEENTDLLKTNEELSKIKTELEKEIEKLKANYESQIQELKRELSNEKEKYKEIKVEFSYCKKIIDTLCNNKIQFNKFALIYTDNTDIVKKVYSEILNCHVTEWESFKAILLNRKIKKLYVQKNKLSTHMVIKIKKFAKENNLDVSLFYANNTKELLENIAYYKIKEV